MAIHVYNTLTKQKEEFVPIQGKKVNIYSCGVTVYDKCHIGHARSLSIFDMICRYLKYRGYDVRFVRNITDVDDKIIQKAKERNKSFKELVEENMALYKKDLKNLGVHEADKEPRATENIDAMITAIEGLIAKGFAYEVEGNVYYSVRQFKEYGKLSGQSVDQMLEATRIDQDARKRDALDFALWKASKEGEPSWESPWGRGRPGWHIECSCMSLRHLGCETLDIHAGGRDLVFPHHENEIAQAEPLHQKPFAKYWIHHGLLTINRQKMSKSLGNFITLDEILERYSSDILKFFFLQSHYRSPVDFSWEKMDEVKKAYDRVGILVNKLADIQKADIKTDEVIKKQQDFQECMDDDFNTPKALSVLFEVVSLGNKAMEENDTKRLAEIKTLLATLISVLGLRHLGGSERELSEDLKRLLEQRKEARLHKDWQRSDELRELLRAKGLIVEDGQDGQRWRYA